MSNYKRGIANNSLRPTLNSNSNSYIDVDIQGCGKAYPSYGIDLSDGESNYFSGRIADVNKAVSIGGFNNDGRVYVENIGDSTTSPAGASVELLATSASNSVQYKTTTPNGVELTDAGRCNSVGRAGMSSAPRWGLCTGTPEYLAHFFGGPGYIVAVGGKNADTNLRFSANGVFSFNKNAASRLVLNAGSGSAVVSAPTSFDAADLLAKSLTFKLDEGSNKLIVYLLLSDGRTLKKAELSLVAGP